MRANRIEHFLQLSNLKIKGSEAIRYKFDACYGANTSQSTFFENEVQPLLDNVFKGLSTTVFAYGVTGAGKTHTMQGSDESPGIIPRAVDRIMEIANNNFASTATVSVSYLEIYNEKVYDLLQPKSQDLPIREDQQRNIFIPNLAEVPIKDLDDFKAAYSNGCKNRTVAATKLNAHSSRSHAILILKVTVKEKGQHALIGKLHLIDLAGSEDNRRTDNRGLRLKESNNINQSLFVLGKVVNALNTNGSRVPYRDSKLTRLLQDSLGGNSYAMMITNIAPGQQFYVDTFNTLNFASKSRLIINNPTVNYEYDKPPEVIDYEVQKKPTMKGKQNAFIQDKENLGNIISANVETIVNKKLQSLLQEKGLLSPWLKKHNVLNDVNLHERLTRLEIKLTEQAAESIEEELREIDENDDCVDYTEPLKDDSVLNTNNAKNIPPQTPTANIKTAKQLIIKAKQLERISHKEALKYFKQAASALAIIPNCHNHLMKISKKIKELESIATEDESEDPYYESPPTPYSIHSEKQAFAGSTPFGDTVTKKLHLPAESNSKRKMEEKQQQSEESHIKKSKKKLKSLDDDYVEIAEEVVPTTKRQRRLSEDSEELDPEVEQQVEAALIHLFNNGTLKDLTKLASIGAKKAEKIIEFREIEQFSSINDLKKVDGRLFSDRFVSKLAILNADVIKGMTHLY